jgi:signal transduction histidine kinase
MPQIEALLIVDDTQTERQLMEITLSEAFPSAEVLSASHPMQAKAMCEGRHFDCVILDYNMPEMDGLTLAHQLRAADAYLATVLMTSFGDELLAAAALRSGISDYIPKGRITAESIQRSVARSMQACSQARVIDQQRLELENFAHALAHDFKQPIRQISTFAMMIAEQLQDTRFDDVQRHLGFLTGATSRLGKLVDVMSQYTLLNQPPELADVDLAQVIDAVRSSLAPYLAERAGRFVAPAHPPIIRGNETLMIQVLQNLVINGLRYNRSATPCVELSVQGDDGHWVIDLSDNGVGIEPAFLTDIFNPLVRLHNAAEYPGTGLGLTLARKAVASQNGSIWCESVLGQGSVFRVRLPAAHSAEMAQFDDAGRAGSPNRPQGGAPQRRVGVTETRTETR